MHRHLSRWRPGPAVITGRVHGGWTAAPRFSYQGMLPGSRYLSGIMSREIKGQRSNQLRFNDSPGKISAQVASEHGNSQLNLGYLTHPPRYRDGLCHGPARGEGAELRSDQAVAIRGAQGVYISAEARLAACGKLLERDGLMGLAEVLKGIQQQLSELAHTHHAEVADGQPLAQLCKHVEHWEDGSNTGSHTGRNAASVNHAGAAADAAGGQPIVAVNAPAGMLLGSGANLAIGAQSHVDIVSAGNTQLSSGRKLLLRAAQSISLFAHTLGMKLIAASGKIEIQSHQDNIEMTSSKRIVISASEEIVLQAPQVTIVTQGAQAVYGGDTIHYQCSGTFAIKSASFSQDGPGGGTPEPLNMPTSKAQHDKHVRLVDLNTGEPLANQRYRVQMEDGQVREGVTDAQGLTTIFQSSIPYGGYTIKALHD